MNDINLVLNILIFIIIGISGYIFKNEKKRIDELYKIVGELKDNYLNRFEDIKDNSNRNHEEVIKEFAKLTTQIEKQQQYCEFVQDQKLLKTKLRSKKNA